MSYDIRFAVKVAGTDKDIYAVIGHPEYDSPTYNLRQIFVKCMDWDYDQGEWYRMDEIIPKIEHGIHELAFHEKRYKPLEPENGWGYGLVGDDMFAVGTGLVQGPMESWLE